MLYTLLSGCFSFLFLIQSNLSYSENGYGASVFVANFVFTSAVSILGFRGWDAVACELVLGYTLCCGFEFLLCPCHWKPFFLYLINLHTFQIEGTGYKHS